MAEEKKDSDPKQNDNDSDNILIQTQSFMPKCLQIATKNTVNLSADIKTINPDIHSLFNKYNKLYFDGQINFCEVKWTETKEDKAQHNLLNGRKSMIKRKKKYAGSCVIDSNGFCCIMMEKSILQFKSNKYLIETLIHQMIHSYLLRTNGVKSQKEAVGHSDAFKLIMSAINKMSMQSIKLSLNNKQCKKNDDCPSEIIPNQLYLGNIHHALNLDILRSIKITHIVNCTQSIENKFESNGLRYIRVPVNDKTSVSILPYFVAAIRFIESVRDENSGKNENRILIHCHAGISRSATITIAYLMYSWKLTMFDAITHVQSKRYIIQPNQGFKNQLLDFYLYLENNEGNLDDFEKKHKASIDILQQTADSNMSNDTNKQKKEYVACPVCDKFFTKKQINKHLDQCVSFN